MIVIDGSYGEGGGQILRTSLTLSLITGKPFRLVNVRAKRKNPGLRPQHLACVKAAAKLGASEVEGDFKGSLEVEFRPKRLVAGSFTFEIGTAGATSLLFQTLYLPLAFAGGGRLLLRGGTHVPMSPCFHYLKWVFAPVLKALGLEVRLELRRYGFYPKGGGEVFAEVSSVTRLSSFREVEPIRTREVNLVSFVTADLPEHIRRRQLQRAERLLRDAGFKVVSALEKSKAPSPGTFVGVWVEEGAKRAGYFALGRKGKPAEAVAEEAVTPLLELFERGGSVDEFLADQILLPLALSKESSEFLTPKVTQHLLTNAWTIKKFLPDVKIEVEGELGAPARVRINV